MLRQSKTERTLRGNLLLASSTAMVSGITNVAGVVAFLAFTSNITGHVANLARHMVEQNLWEILIFAIWLGMFFFGAFLATYIVRTYEGRSYYKAHSIPIIIETVILLFVAIYGHNFYKETQTEREIVIAAILFAMGLQNSLVSTTPGYLPTLAAILPTGCMPGKTLPKLPATRCTSALRCWGFILWDAWQAATCSTCLILLYFIFYLRYF